LFPNQVKRAFTLEAEWQLTLKVKNVTKSWGSFALKNINLTVNDGEYLVILGPTGSGKTLLLETIVGFNKPDEGRIIMDGKDITEVAPEKRGIGYVPQNSLLFPHLTIRQNLAFGLKMRGMKRAEQDRTVEHILDLVKLRSIESHQPESLSGGERQKVALARVLAIDSKIILLDEPLASMDPETSRELRDELKRIHREDGKTIIHVTHSLIEGFSLADKLALMREGEMVQVGGAKELLAKPRNEFAARLLGYENVYRAKLMESENAFSILDVEGVKVRVSGRVESVGMVALRPEDITVELSPVGDVNANVLKASIIEYADLGSMVMIKADAGLLLNVAISKNSFIEKELETGKQVWLNFKDNTVRTIE
jgi:ABC-type Fe3+/spermidine/putrescine transport system ATPase subunit